MEMPMMYHPYIPTPTLPTPSMPSWLRRAYIATAPQGIPNTLPAGSRPVPPPTPPVVTPSGVPGPGSTMEGAEYGPALAGGIPIGIERRRALSARDREMMSQAQIDEYNRLLRAAGGPISNGDTEAINAYDAWNSGIAAGQTVVQAPAPWSWPRGRVPRNAQEREEKTAYDAGNDETTRALPGQNVDEMRKLLKELEAALGSADLTNAQNAQVQGMIDAIRKWLAQQPTGAAPTPTPAPTPAPEPTPVIKAGQLGHNLPWNGVGIGNANERKLAGFVVGIVKGQSTNYVLYQMLTGSILQLRDFARKLWELHSEGNAFGADDLLADAIANSDPALAQALRDIEEFTRQAEPAAKPAAGFASRPTR